MGAVCHRPVLRPVGAGRLWWHGSPRITCNAYLTTQRKAWDVLSGFLLGDALYAGMERADADVRAGPTVG
ncbi:Host specificity protein J of prophage [Escherichia coli]|uniref:Host specificity protein J of prophage n=1 Tax=Escherichia coli TaxID=562 RepID=A0A376UEU8_ECOLX|nr:Host specificity protein J of prophage [Escherichia coli]